MRSPPDWDEKIAKFYGLELQSVSSTKDGVRFKFKEGGQCTLVNVTVGGEVRSFEKFEAELSGKLKEVEILSCHQISASGLPVRSRCLFSVIIDEEYFLFSAFNEHDGTDPEVAGFQFDVK